MAPLFLLSRLTNRGNLRSAGISRFIAKPLQLTGSHHSRRGHPTPSFHIGHGTRVLPLRLIPQGLLDRRSPGYLHVVAQLDAVLDPGVSASHSSLPCSPHGLRPIRKDRHPPKIQDFSELCVRFRASPFTSLRSLFFLSTFAVSHYTS